MAIVLALLFFAVLIAWKDSRRLAIWLFALSFIFAIGILIYHMTDKIGLSL